MPPYYRRRYYYRNWWNKYKRRNAYRRRRSRQTFRRNRRRPKWVRRKFFRKRLKRKLKKIKITQWQPSSIKRCRIEGYLPLFQAGKGRFSYNYAHYKESFVPEHTPGGGGWSIQQITLNNLYTMNSDLQNIWTKSNYRLNLCRYEGCKLTLFRNPYTDYVFTYFAETPKIVSKYFYASHHPYNLLTHNRKKIVTSFQTQPHKRKIFKTLRLPPPKMFKNQWYFQQQFADIPLLNFACSALSLYNMYGSNTSQNSNSTFYCLDTTFFKSPCFQYKTATTPQYGYRISDTVMLFGIPQAHEPLTSNKMSNAVYLGNTMLNDAGDVIGNTDTNWTTYNLKKWGNPFYWGYMTGNMPVFQKTINSTTTIDSLLKNPAQRAITQSEFKSVPYVFKIRYNPYKDKGKGNKAYFIPTYNASHNNWEPTSDPDLMFENFPFWIMLWGIADIIAKMGKCPHIDDDWVLVLKSKYFNTPEHYYVPLSYSFVHGTAPYNNDREDISTYDNSHWYPKFKFQREAIEYLIQTGPAVCRSDNIKNIQAVLKYSFYFKWGGSPAPMENVYDPTTQPITPMPNNLNLPNEITDPKTPIETMLYQWDQRRDFITGSAAKSITESPTDDHFMFTDGKKSSTDLQIYPEKTQEKTTQKEKEETILLQLQQLEQYNLQLQQRLLRLTQLSQDQ
nr:MAG: ORF1 [TTV-like mini virus]